MAPWVHMHMAPQGQIFPCCISAHYLDESPGDLKDKSLEEIWNSGKMKKIRKNMMNGKGNKLCELCYQYESIGKKSPRNDMNQEFGKHYSLVSDHTQSNGHLDKYEIKYIDFRFSNLCNFKCRICSHHFSTSWYQEAIKMNTASPDSGRLIVPVEDPEDLWNQIMPILPHLEKIHFAGGEPLIMEEHYRILKYLRENRMFDVNLTYNTNFSETRFKDSDAITVWKQFKHVLVCASLDGMGKRGEYMRKGQDWEQTVENRKRMLNECPHVRFQLTPAVGILNALHIPDFFKDWVDQGLMQPEELNMYVVFEPEFYNLQRLPDFFKKRIEDKYRDFFSGYLSKFNSKVRSYVEGQFIEVLNHMNKDDQFQSASGSYKDNNFITYNRKLDALRNEDLLEVFPELEDLYKEEMKPMG
ncbi:MAG: twitch domain-containing radical SAM protein [Bacteroidetes bacterium]|nr:twitch domain-containing radical SAM protein [Bacteroidota bacterium]